MVLIYIYSLSERGTGDTASEHAIINRNKEKKKAYNTYTSKPKKCINQELSKRFLFS